MVVGLWYAVCGWERFPFEESFIPHNGMINGKLIGKINSVLDILKYNPKATIPDLMEATGKGQRTISRELKEYQEAGQLQREGSRKTGHWVVE